MPRLSIRARLTLWYAVVLFIVLALASVAIVSLHTRLEQTRMDEELEGASQTVAGVIHNEIDERLKLPQAAEDMLEELNLPGIGVAVLNSSRDILASTATGREPHLSEEAIKSAATSPDFVDQDGQRMRRLAVSDRHRDFAYFIAVWTSTRESTLESATLRDAMWLGVPIALLLASAGGWTIARSSLRPLADMAHQADSVDRGMTGAQLHVPNPDDELGLMARAFNRLLGRASESLRAQRAFMADASHQLRTPVSVIRTSAQVTLSRDDRTADEYRESLEIVTRQSQRLTKMVDDMFMLAMVDAQGRPLERAPLYLNEIVDSVAHDARPLAIERGVTLTNAPSDDISCHGDEHLIRQMLWNLIENALRYSPAGATIALSIDKRGDRVEVTVKDDGPGIPAADRERVFDRFVRLEGAGGAAGAGLGLPIARWIAEAHGGSLTLDDADCGCCFRITLPCTD
jgi:two-component system, OmpR family, sensor kinase